MQLENSFEVAASSEAAWELLMDVPRVIPCMPGAELVETVDDTHWKARMRVKLGPISLSFLTDVTREEVDEGERRVRLAARAREERGRGAAQATIESSLTPAESGTRVTTVTDLALTGMAAQFGRGLIEDVTAQLLQSFADCLEQQLATSAEDSPEVEPDPPRPVSGLALGAAAMQQHARAAQERDVARMGLLLLPLPVPRDAGRRRRGPRRRSSTRCSAAA